MNRCEEFMGKTKKGGVIREKTEARHPNLTTKKRMNYSVKVNEAKKEGSNVIHAKL